MTFREGAENKDGIEKLAPETDDDDNETKVRLDDAEDDSDGGDDGEEADDKTPAGKNTAPDGQPRKKDGTWAAKKAQRGADRKVASQWQQEKAEYDRRIARMQEDTDRSIRQMREELERVQRGGGQQPHDPFEAKLDDIGRQMEQELKLIESDDKRDYTHYRRLQRQEQALITQRELAIHSARTLQQQRQQPQQSNDPRQTILAAEFPWTVDSRYNDLGRKAYTYKQYLVEVEGRPDNLETDREALMTIQSRLGAEFGLSPPPAPPTPRTRQMYGGPPSRGAPARRELPREVDLGEVGRGHGLSPKRMAEIMRDYQRDSEG